MNYLLRPEKQTDKGQSEDGGHRGGDGAEVVAPRVLPPLDKQRPVSRSTPIYEERLYVPQHLSAEVEEAVVELLHVAGQ